MARGVPCRQAVGSGRSPFTLQARHTRPPGARDLGPSGRSPRGTLGTPEACLPQTPPHGCRLSTGHNATRTDRLPPGARSLPPVGRSGPTQGTRHSPAASTERPAGPHGTLSFACHTHAHPGLPNSSTSISTGDALDPGPSGTLAPKLTPSRPFRRHLPPFLHSRLPPCHQLPPGTSSAGLQSAGVASSAGYQPHTASHCATPCPPSPGTRPQPGQGRRTASMPSPVCGHLSGPGSWPRAHTSMPRRHP